MIAEGVYDPENQAGIDFCINYCPYDRCILFEDGRKLSSSRRDKRVMRAAELYNEGYSIEDISKELKVSVRSIQRYLKR